MLLSKIYYIEVLLRFIESEGKKQNENILFVMIFTAICFLLLYFHVILTFLSYHESYQIRSKSSFQVYLIILTAKMTITLACCPARIVSPVQANILMQPIILISFHTASAACLYLVKQLIILLLIMKLTTLVPCFVVSTKDNGLFPQSPFRMIIFIVKGVSKFSCEGLKL